MIIEKIKPSNYINLRRKLCNPQVIITANQLAYDWGLTPEEACYRILNEALMKEHIKRKESKK